jgi:hypothetical protein
VIERAGKTGREEDAQRTGSARGGILDSAGINRLEVANERVVQERSSESSWPQAMRGRS